MESPNLIMEAATQNNVEYLVDMDFENGENSLGMPSQANCASTSFQVNVAGKLKVTDLCSSQHDLWFTTIPGNYYEFSADFDVTDASNFFLLHVEHQTYYGAGINVTNLGVSSGNTFVYGFTASTISSRISLRNIRNANDGGTFIVDNIKVKHWLPQAQGDAYYSASQKVGDKRYELSNHLGNVLNVVTDRKLPQENTTDPGTTAYYKPNVVSFSDYDPFGMQMLNRHGNVGGYRFGFNGMQKDDEIKNIEGSSYDFGARMYDSRVGRFLSIDKYSPKYPDVSNYSFAANNPLNIIDINGDSLYILVSGIPTNAYTKGGRKEFDKLGFNTLLNTTEGKVLIEKYANSSRHDVYVAIGSIPSDGKGITGALTINKHLRPEDQKKTKLPKEFKIFDGLKLKSKKVTYSLMLINEDLVNLSGSFSDKTRFQKLDIAETFYHELKAHIDLSKYAYSKTSIGEKAGELQHEKYGVEHNNSLGIYQTYQRKSENNKTPYSVIVEQLQTVQRNGETRKQIQPKKSK